MKSKTILLGGAGLVGQNLIAQLISKGYQNLVVIDKQTSHLEKLYPHLVVECADLAEEGPWTRHFEGASSVVMLQAQIGGLDRNLFIRNTVVSTQRVLEAIKQYGVPYTVHVSSSASQSAVNDLYTTTKRMQEELVLQARINCVVLRPTLMFGAFDQKHLGWLERFMRIAPIFPIPGQGRYVRQPLYVVDFCKIILHCIEHRISGRMYNISGLEPIDYIDIIRHIKKQTNSRCLIVKIPYNIFHILLKLWAVFDRDPPFTADQLKALTQGEMFEVISWPSLFQVTPTPFTQALEQTFNASS